MFYTVTCTSLIMTSTSFLSYAKSPEQRVRPDVMHWLNVFPDCESVKGVIRTALPTQKTSGSTLVLLATEMPSTMSGRPSQMDDLTMIPAKGGVRLHVTPETVAAELNKRKSRLTGKHSREEKGNKHERRKTP